MGRGLLPAPSCSLPRHAGVGSREQAQPPLPALRRRSPSGGGAPPALGGRRAAPVAPLLRWVRGGGGGGWGGRPLACPRVCAGGGGGLGGALWPPGDASRRPWGGGAGAAWRPWSRGPAIGQGVAPVTRPPYRELDARAGPRRGPHLPGRCRAAPAGRGWLMVSGQWLAGCGAAGSSPRLSPPHSLPRVAARPRTYRGGGVGQGAHPPLQPSRVRRLGLLLRRRLCGGWGCGGGGLCRR